MTEQQPPQIAEPDTEPQTLVQLEDAETDAPLVGIIMGSQSDMDTMQGAAKVLEDAGVRAEIRVMSAHRDPDQVADYCRNARMRGLRVLIAGAGAVLGDELGLAVRRHDLHLVLDARVAQHAGGAVHDVHVALGAHDDPDARGRGLDVLQLGGDVGLRRRLGLLGHSPVLSTARRAMSPRS